MSQNSVIFGALFVGFLVYITTRGELPAYISVFTRKKVAQPGTVPLTGEPIQNPTSLMPGSLGRAGITVGQAAAPGQAIWNWITGNQVNAPASLTNTGSGPYVDLTSGF